MSTVFPVMKNTISRIRSASRLEVYVEVLDEIQAAIRQLLERLNKEWMQEA